VRRPLKIDLKWDKPIRLKDGSKENLNYSVKDGLESISTKPGVYVFARTYNVQIAPLYIGQASKLRESY
jgi:hypothetical protein